MFTELHVYLVQRKKLCLPGIGTISLERQPAGFHFANRSFSPPVYSYIFQQGKEVPIKSLYNWLANFFHITERESVIRLNDFLFDLKRKIGEGKEISWQGVGKFRK